MSELTVTSVSHGPFDHSLDRARIAAYVHATGDQTPPVRDGLAVPAVFPVLLVFGPNEVARADLPEAAYRDARGGVHGEHDIVLHRPLVPGEPLQTWSRISAVRTTTAGTQVVMQFDQRDRDGVVVVEQWWTMMLLGLQGMADLGVAPAEHRFPDEARARPFGSVSHHIDADITRRYDVARAAGFDFVFTHGLCTMAICTHRVLGVLGVDDPGRIRRVAVRFAAPTPLGCDLTVNVFGIAEHSFAFEAEANDTKTITHGRLELRA